MTVKKPRFGAQVRQSDSPAIRGGFYLLLFVFCLPFRPAEGFICRPGPKLIIDNQIIAAIRQAILECHQIKITYFNKMSGKTSTNTLDPYGFLYGERNHYLVAHHSDGYFGDNVHNFILGNIKSVEILDIPLM